MKYPPRKRKKKKPTLKEILELIALSLTTINAIMELLSKMTGRD